MSIKRILFINFGGLGDEILFLPTILAVKNQYPDSEITLALEKRSSGIVQLTDVIDKTIYADIKGKNKYFELFRLLLKVWQNQFDMVISSGSNKFISLFLFMTFVKRKYGYNTGKLSTLLLTKAVELNKNQYAGRMYYDLVKSIVNKDFELPCFSIKKKPQKMNTVLVHPGVSRISLEKGMVKTIQPNQWAEIIEGLADKGKQVLLVGGPDDKDCIEIIQKIVPSEKYENLYGKTQSLRDLAELISSAEKFVCSDSAPLHVAVGLGIRTYVIFGPTDEKKLVPDLENIITIKSGNHCLLQPCLWEKRQKTCEKLYCLDIPTDKIIDTIINV